MTHGNEPLYDIKLLGQLEVWRDGKLLNKPHKTGTKAHKVLACLILARGKAVSDYRLIRTMGMNQDKKALNSLKVLIHRIRKMLTVETGKGAICIIRTFGGYAWNMGFARVDLFAAEFLFERVLSARKPSRIDPQDINALVDLYGSEPLPEMWDEPWAELAAQDFEHQCKAATTHVLTLMWKAGAAEQVIQTCLRGLKNDPMEPLFWDHLNRARYDAKRNTGKLDDMRGDLIMRGSG